MTLGHYGLKARSAFEAEETTFDTSYHIMNQRDTDGLLGYVYIHVCHKPYLYVSWFGECLSHTLIDRSLGRHYYNSDFSKRLAFDPDFKCNLGIRRARKDKIYVRSWGRSTHGFECLHPDYFKGGEASSVGTPGKFELHVRFVTRDQLMDPLEFVWNCPIFVSKVCLDEELYTNLFAIYTASRNELPYWEGDITLLLANIDYVQLNAYMTNLQLRINPYERFNIVDVVHWLMFTKLISPQRGVTYPIADRQKVRDFISYNSVRFESGDALVSILDVGGGSNTIYIAVAPWINRFAHCYEILALKVNIPVCCDEYYSLKECCYIRGVMIGHLIDLANQVVAGHWYNLTRYCNVKLVADQIQAICDVVMNTCVIGDTSTTLGMYARMVGFGVNAGNPLRYTDQIAKKNGEGVESRQYEVSLPEDSNWLIMLRADWLRAFGNSGQCYIRTSLSALDYSKFKFVGPNTVLVNDEVE